MGTRMLRRLHAATTLPLLPGSASGKEPLKLWVQAWQPTATAPGAAAAIGTEILVTLAATTIGNLVTKAAEALTTDDEFSVRAVVPVESMFVVRNPDPLKTDFAIKRVVINYGPGKVELEAGAIREDDNFRKSPVVVGIEFLDGTNDPGGTAIGARISQWKYLGFQDPTRRCLREPIRKVSFDVEFLKPDGGSLLKWSLLVSASKSTIATAAPNDGRALPWIARPALSYPSGAAKPTPDMRFGPGNLSVVLKEVAGPSRLSRIFGSTLSANKAAIEDLVKSRVREALDEKAAATAQLAKTTAATSALAAYEAAYNAVVAARDAHRAATGDRTALEQAFGLKKAVLRQQEVLARDAFDRAGLSFAAYPTVTL